MATTPLNDEAPSAPPDWQNVHFDVPCARCGHDLRGLSESTCPACELEFDWSDAVPLEHLKCLHCDYHLYGLPDTRCPECGEPFAWEEVLDAYRRRQKPLFEYRWRNTPVRSLVRTWVWALRPNKFWARLDIHDPPDVRGLLILLGATMVAFTLSLIVLEGVEVWMWYRNWRTGGMASLNALPDILLNTAMSLHLYSILASALAWWIMCFASLLIFRQSMQRCRVRTVHVLRVWAYSIPLMFPVVTVAVCVASYMSSAFGFYSARHPGIPAAIALVAYAVWSVRCGYKTYLRVPHSGAVAIASQLVALFGLAVFELLFLQGPICWTFVNFSVRLW